MKKRATSRVVLVSGASDGIGKALAEAFATHGDVVALLSRNRGRLAKVRKGIQQAGGKAEAFPCDVRREREVAAAARRVVQRFGGVDILVNSAGVTYFKSIEQTSPKEFDEVIDTNLRGTFLLTKALLPSMLGRGKGMILNIVSHVAKAVYAGSGAYTASKAGVEGLMNVLRAETRARGLRVVNVYPGAVLTSIWHKRHREKHADRMMSPAEVAQVVYQLTIQPPSMMTEEIVLRPQGGDLKV